MRRPVLLLAASFVLLALTACRFGHSAELGAATDDKEALMHAAFPQWDAASAPVLRVPPAARDSPGHVVASPELVLKIDETHRVLLVKGIPSDEKGDNQGGHSSPGNLGAYWFERHDGRWMAGARQDSVVWTGVSGDVGTLKPVDLGGGHQAVALEAGSCWQGMCADWLSLVEFDAARAHAITDDVFLMSTSLDAVPGCKERLEGHAIQAQELPFAIDADNCFDVHGRWRIAPRDGSERGDLVVEFSGRDLFANAKTHALSPRRIQESLTLGYADGAYKPARGHNPTHGI
jgi:hypothetical protein